MTLAWPPAYTLKENLRAKRVLLKASVRHGLQLIVPRRFNKKEIPQILEQHRVWINKQLLKIHEKQQLIETETLPEQIILHTVSQIWRVAYIATQESSVQLIARPHQEIALLGQIRKKENCKKLLSNWTKLQSRKHLPDLLSAISQEINLPYANVTIRNQQTRWGSCSTNKNINLNYKLIFLPLHLTRHIIIHELCHTVQPNHSEKFWRLVAKYDKNWEEHNHSIRKTDQWIPSWAE